LTRRLRIGHWCAEEDGHRATPARARCAWLICGRLRRGGRRAPTGAFPQGRRPTLVPTRAGAAISSFIRQARRTMQPHRPGSAWLVPGRLRQGPSVAVLPVQPRPSHDLYSQVIMTDAIQQEVRQLFSQPAPSAADPAPAASWPSVCPALGWPTPQVCACGKAPGVPFGFAIKAPGVPYRCPLKELGVPFVPGSQALEGNGPVLLSQPLQRRDHDGADSHPLIKAAAAQHMNQHSQPDQPHRRLIVRT
jgi:hypothetical protein